MMKELKYIAENRLSETHDSLTEHSLNIEGNGAQIPVFRPLFPESRCGAMDNKWHGSLHSLAWFLLYWRENFSAAYDLNRVFLIGSDNLCIADFCLRNMPSDHDNVFNTLHERILSYRNSPQEELGDSLFWISQGPRPGMGYFYTLVPVYLENRLQALLGMEHTIRVKNFLIPSSLPIGVTILAENNRVFSGFGVEKKFAAFVVKPVLFSTG